MRYAGLRISDVITLAREHIQGQYLVKRAVLPLPKGAATDKRRYQQDN